MNKARKLRIYEPVLRLPIPNEIYWPLRIFGVEESQSLCALCTASYLEIKSVIARASPN